MAHAYSTGSVQYSPRYPQVLTTPWLQPRGLGRACRPSPAHDSEPSILLMPTQSLSRARIFPRSLSASALLRCPFVAPNHSGIKPATGQHSGFIRHGRACTPDEQICGPSPEIPRVQPAGSHGAANSILVHHSTIPLPSKWLGVDTAACRRVLPLIGPATTHERGSTAAAPRLDA